MTQFKTLLRRLGAALLKAMDFVRERYENGSAWSEKLFLS